MAIEKAGEGMSPHESAETSELSLERLVAVLRRRWWVIALTTLLVGVAAFVFSERQTKEYTATTSLVFQDQTVTQEAAGLQGSAPTSLDPNLMATNVSLLTSQEGVAAATAQIVGHHLTAADVARSLSATQQGTTDIASLSATTPHPRLAAEIANTYAQQFIASQRSQQQATATQALDLVKRQIAALSPEQRSGLNGQNLLDREEALRVFAKLANGGAQITTVATVPSSPTSPKTNRNTALGLLLGLLLGIGIVYLFERLDRRMKNVEELSTTYQLPLLATVPRNKAYVRREASGAGYGDGEVFKLLRAYLRYFNVDRELKLLLVASAAPGDGKTTIAHNLAEAAQEMGTRTLLLEADLRRSCLAAHYGLTPAPGLSELLTGNADLGDAIRSVPIASRLNGSGTVKAGTGRWSRAGTMRGEGGSNGPGDASSTITLPPRNGPGPDREAELCLDVLVAGHHPPNPAELLQSHAMADLLEEVRDSYGLTVIDTPPLAVVADAMPLLQKVDGVILVSQLGKNTRDAARFLRERLRGVRAPLLGVVANGVKTKTTDGYGYGYEYGSYGSDVNGHPTEEPPGSPAVTGEPMMPSQ